MTIRSVLSTLVLFLVSVPISTAIAAADVKVLLAKGAGILDFQARDVIEQMNDTLDNSGLGSSRQVSSAVMSLGLPFVYTSTCTGTDADAVVQCAKNEFEGERNSQNADIVVLVVATLNKCGTTLPGTVNRPTISWINHGFAYAVVKNDCMEFPSDNMKAASHEIGHILSLEHSTDPPLIGDPSKPVPDNHAAEDYDDLTVMGIELGNLVGDCPFTSCTINDFFSENGKVFPDGGAAGNLAYANAKNVVKDKSWDIVAAYRPIPAPQACLLSWEFLTCNGQVGFGLVTATLPGYTVLNADYDASISGGPWIDVFEGLFTCPGLIPQLQMIIRAILLTQYGTSQCTIVIPFPNCDDPIYPF